MELEKLKDHLRMYAEKKKNPDAPDVNELLKFDLTDYIKRRFQDKIKKEVIAEEISSLCYEDFLIPEELSEWCDSQLKKFSKTNPLSPKSESSNFSCNTESIPPEPLSPTQLKDMMYHSCFCCQMVNSCTSKDYAYFFDNAENQNHSFTEVSMSILRDGSTERYVIARQKDAVYLAFLSEPHICDWLTKYNSFEQGKD